jgi:hypothetical protein
VPDETDETTTRALQELFLQYGPPLVLKCDNGSAFRSELLQTLLGAWRVVPLFSPPCTPRYNGACEAANHALKSRTQQQAEFSGHPEQWTAEDLEQARRHSNELYLPDERAWLTAQEHWNAEPPIDDNERQTFLDTVARIRGELPTRLTAHNAPSTSPPELAKLDRRVLRRALVELGLLTTTRRSIALPLSRRKMARIL